MRTRSKRYRQQVALAEQEGGLRTPRDIPAAVALVKRMARAKFTESVDLSIKLNLDTKKADQQFRGSFSLPHGTGRAVRVIAFVDDADRIAAALAAGAVKAGGEDLVKAVEGGFMDFDVALATPKMMRLVGRLGKVLGPRGLMPSPKSGTVTDDIAAAVSAFKGGRIEFRSDAAGNVHVRVGTVKFEDAKLVENITAFLRHVADSRPATVKGAFIQSVTLSSTMGPGVRIAFAEQKKEG
ncbi:MAG: 50S ribosomal protein L1 [Planctomycetota bacterium]|nr:50S ribosomal protein L1 [Planctomycetota bacterium]MCX8040205.1 50S ribosomal protein L1 [Planctomycetota bacterium]MDW8372500.1 50S ribosomal protein L1 [Planctomycetota bacterium]